MKKRILSVLMALALCLTLLPAPAWAAEDTLEGGTIVQEEQEETTPATSEQAVEDASEGGTIVQEEQGRSHDRRQRAVDQHGRRRTVQFRNEHAYGDLVRKKARFHWPQL